MYCDEVQLEADTVLATLYVAKKYIVPHLARACVNYLETSLTAKNACLLLSQSRLFEEPDLMQRCWEVIDAQVSPKRSSLASCRLRGPCLYRTLSWSDDRRETRLKKWQTQSIHESIRHDSHSQLFHKLDPLSYSASNCFLFDVRLGSRRKPLPLYRTNSEPQLLDARLDIEVTQNLVYKDSDNNFRLINGCCDNNCNDLWHTKL